MKIFPEVSFAISLVTSLSYSFLFPTYQSYETTWYHIIAILFYTSLPFLCFESPSPALLTLDSNQVHYSVFTASLPLSPS